MMSSTRLVLAQIASERARQDARWGGPTHDDSHAPGDWLLLINRRVLRAHAGRALGTPVYRRALVEIAALAVAALESLDRGMPHGPGGQDAAPHAVDDDGTWEGWG